MKRLTKIMSLLLAVAMLLTVVGCSSNTNPTGSTPNGNANPTTTGTSGDNKSTYVVKVQSAGGLPLKKVDVMIYDGDNLVQVGATADDGTYTVKMKPGTNYTVQLNAVPEGYSYEASYSFNGANCIITLNSAPVANGNMGTKYFQLGDIMYDFEFTDTEGNVQKLSEVLKEKKMVMINLWDTGCSWCEKEFPVINASYANYKDKIEIFALSDSQFDTMDDVRSWKDGMSLTFPMGLSRNGLGISSFGSTGRPVTVIIDRYGMVAMAHAGAILSESVWNQMFYYFTAEDYTQKLIADYNDLISIEKPNVEFPGSDAVNEAVSQNGLNINFYPSNKDTDPDSYEYIWPFVVTEFNGETCIKASNSGKDSSYAILYAEVELQKGQAVGFDYIISSELGIDAVYVIVNGEDVYRMSGYDENPQWKACYPWVALEDGTYTVAICYSKDGSTNAGDDTIYIDNFRVIDAADIDVDSYIPRQAAVKNGNTYSYVDVFFNEQDGYYHVGSVDGPLLLANLMGYSQFSSKKSVYEMAYNNEIVKNGYNYINEITEFAGYAANATLNGYCTVTQELAELLQIVAEIKGFDAGEKNEWLKICEYYQTYGPNGTTLEDPIRGLAPFSAPEVTLGKWVENENGELVFQGANGETGLYNYFYYDRPIIPRGMFYKFTPSVSGAYRITSHTDYTDGLDAWLFTEEGFYSRDPLFTFTAEERAYMTSDAVNLVYYMEAGQTYYIDIAFWDVYAVGYIFFDMEFLGEEYDMFRLASPGYFTYVEDNTDYILAGGIEVAMGDDGYYHHVLDKNNDGKPDVDENGNYVLGSILYADFTQLTPIFSTSLKDMIDAGSFNFAMNEEDQFVYTMMKKNNFDADLTRAALVEYWGADAYEYYAEAYMVEDVLAGNYHGVGQDMTEAARAILAQMITEEGTAYGCVMVTAEVAELLQMLMDKFTFEGVENSWRKLCYYYDYMGR